MSSSKKTVCVIGAGSSGIAAARALKERGIGFDCFEKGSQVGGHWRYENDNGLSSTYASLRTNTSRKQTGYPSFPMPSTLPDYPGHEQMAEYLDAFVDHFGIREDIRFETEVESVEPLDRGFEVTLKGGESRRYRYVVAASGHSWAPHVPELPGNLEGGTSHARTYRRPEPFGGRRVAVLGFGNSGTEIASELVGVAEAVFLCFRRTQHVLPRFIWRWPIDLMDTKASARFLPWWYRRLTMQILVRLFAKKRTEEVGLAAPDHKLLHYRPTTSDQVLGKIAAGLIAVKPPPKAMDGKWLEFEDGSREQVDHLIFATGYRLSFPFLPEGALESSGKSIRLYRRIVHPPLPDVFFVGLFDAIGALPPVLEAQAEWIAEVITGRVRLPQGSVMERELERDDARSRRRFDPSPPHSLLLDRFPYVLSLERDLRGRPWPLPERRPEIDSKPR